MCVVSPVYVVVSHVFSLRELPCDVQQGER